MKIKPLGKRVLVKEVEQETEEETTEGGIVIPESAKEEDRFVTAEVKAVGTDEKIEVKEGDQVILSSFSGTDVELDDEELTIVKDKDILAIVE
ncbi:MAG: co-chaperone GroES [Candidatus Bipolaricaulota bacterium]